jgi:glycerol uptake facilitator-like aquaporin
MAMVYSLGDISGAHLNPAVSFAFWTSQELTLSDFFKYTASQSTGALVASGLLKYLFPQSK